MALPHPSVLSKFITWIRDRILVRDNSVEPAHEMVYTFAVPDAATGDVDIVVKQKCEVVDVECQKQNGAGAGNTVTIKKGAAAISDAIACAVDTAVTRAANIDDANSLLAEGDTLRASCTRAAGTRNSLVKVTVLVRP